MLVWGSQWSDEEKCIFMNCLSMQKTLTECLHFSVLSSQIKRQPTEVENKERLE